MENADSIMKKIKAKENPDTFELQKYIRYLINVLKYDENLIYEDVSHWKKADVADAITKVERENSKPAPKRYYVSLKDPLDEER